MLGGGITGAAAAAAVTLTLTGAKDAFLRLAPELRAQLRLEQGCAVEVTWDEQPVYLGWMESRSRNADYTAVELSRQMAEKLGLVDGQQVILKPCSMVPSCKEVTVEPLSADDWEILELHAAALEMHLLDQIRIVYPKAVFPVWVDLHTCIYIQIGALTPAASYGRLEPLTELIVTPKSRTSENVPSHLPPFKSADCDLGSRRTTQGTTSSSDTSSLRDISEIHTPQASSVWDSIVDLFSWALGKNPSQTPGASDRDVFGRTLLKSVSLEAIFRVSRRVPPIISNSQAFLDHTNDNTVQVFLWYPEPPGLIPDVVVSYGTIVEIPSPKRRKKNSKASAEGSEGKKESADAAAGIHEAVVKIVWHGFEDIKDVIEYDTRNGNTHIAKVWIPERLRKSLNINISSAVRIQSLEAQPKIPSSIVLQPKQRLDKDVAAEDVKAAFGAWLQSHSTSSSPWISGKTDTAQLSLGEEIAEFTLSLDDSSEPTNQDEIFLLCQDSLQKTKIHVNLEFTPPENAPTLPQPDQNLTYLQMNRLGGVDGLLTACYEHIVHCLMGRPLSRQFVSTASGLRSGAVLLSGPKGCGKSAVAKALCTEAFDGMEAYVEEINCKLLKGKTLESLCQTLEEGFAEAAWRQPAVLLLDDLDQIAGVPATPEQEQSPEAMHSKQVSHVLKDLMKEIIRMETQIAVIATSQSEHSLNPILISSQGVHLFQCLKAIHPPAQKERSELLRCIVENRLSCDIARFGDLDLPQLAKETEGFVAKDFVMLAERAIESSVATRKIYSKRDLVLSTSDLQKALKGFTPMSLKNANLHKPKDQGWTVVGGLHSVRQVLKDTIELPAKYPELFANLPIRHRSGVLLYGAPGTGKTLLAGVIAHESGMNFISIKGPELLSKYIGASEQAVRDVFTRAQAARPCILFFDEFDSIAPQRGHDNTGVTDRVVNQMLTELDGVEGLQGVYVLAATSRPDLIDPALLRPGRLDECLYCPPPDQVSRYEILKGLSCSMMLDRDVDFQYIASRTENFTGADLKALLYNAQLEAIHSSLAPSAPQDSGSGSDSDASLSSMIFLNHSSASDESSGEPDSALEQSFTSLDMVKIPPDDSKSNIWRLYFGSSNDSDLGNGSSDQTCHSLSGSNSITYDFTGLSVGELVSSQPLVFLTSSAQEDLQEHCQNARAETALTNYKNLEEPPHCQMESKKKMCVGQKHLLAALATTRPSISAEDWRFFNHLYEKFQNPKSSSGQTHGRGQKVTLA
ncbi:peroxisome biogenesis factor 1 isoform X2 [Bufo bufo]|uniref:peroxisome biogenesis factor 1 isoform X2 n=1 Tax=Bufo bufo TaxID=8384 RepID=UPI001ABE329D|nr:peroxisome biogenesis factor 1 isoform X2 [Bufo bufo]